MSEKQNYDKILLASGIVLGLGETEDELFRSMDDLPTVR